MATKQTRVIGLDEAVVVEIRTTFGGVLVVTDEGNDGVRVEYRRPVIQKNGGDEEVLPGDEATAVMVVPVPSV